MAKDYVDDMLEKAEKGKLGGTLKNSRPEGQPVPRPRWGQIWTAPPQPDKTPPSKAPYGMASAVKGDIGMYRQKEAGKAFSRRSLGGGTISNPLHYRTPETAIDGKFGPGDKVC